MEPVVTMREPRDLLALIPYQLGFRPEASAVLTGALGDPDATVRGRAALALGREGAATAVPVLIGMVVEGDHDVEAAEALGTLSNDPACGARIATALADALAAPTADSQTRIRLTQALVELQGTAAQETLRRLTLDEDPVVALLASRLLGVLDERSDS